MSVDLPGKLEFLDVDMPSYVSGQIQSQSMYVYDGGDLVVLTGRVVYSSSVVPSGEGMLVGAARGIGTGATVSDLSYQPRQVAENKFALEGQFKQYARDYKLLGCSYVKEHKVWLIVVSYDSGNNAASAAAQRIMDSVNIKD